MATKKAKVEVKTLTRESFTSVHIAYTGKTKAQMLQDFTAHFADTLHPERSLLDEAVLDYFTTFAYECKANHLPYYKYFYAFRLSLFILHIISTGNYVIDDLCVALLSKINNLLSPISGLTYNLSTVTTAEYENAAEPITLDDNHDGIVYIDSIIATECYNTLTGQNKPLPVSEAAGQATKPAGGAKPKQAPVEEKRYAFVLTIDEANLLSRLYSPLLQSHALWRQCFAHQKLFIEGVECVVLPSNPDILSIPPLSLACPSKKLSALEAKIITVARPKAAALYRELKDAINEKVAATAATAAAGH